MKISRHTTPPDGTFKPPSRRFEHLPLDIFGPLPVSQGKRYAITCVDRFTRWPKVFPMHNIEAATVARALYDGWISRFGTPLRITTNQGRQFESQLFEHLHALLGCNHIRTCAYHPQSNDMIERFHRQLKAAIRCHATSRWTEVLPTILLGVRSAWKEDLEATSAEMVFGESLRLSGQFLAESDSRNQKEASDFLRDLRDHFAELRPSHGVRHGEKKTFIFKELYTASHVFVRRDTTKTTFDAPYEGTLKVISRGDHNFKIE